MTDWIPWLVIAGLVVTLEVFTGTFYLLMIAFGLLAGGLAAFLGAGFPLQLIVAAAVGASGIYILRRSKLGQGGKKEAARDPNVNLDIGQTVFIESWSNGEGRPVTARAMYRGAMWNIELAPGATAQPGTYTIREIRGSNLIVAGAAPAEH